MNVLLTGRLRPCAGLTLALVLAGGLVACSGAGSPGVAAQSAGTVVTEEQLDAVVADFSRVEGAQAPTRAQLVTLLALRPYILQAASTQASVPTTEFVAAQIGSQLPEASAATLEFLQANAATQGLDQAAQMRILQEAQVVVDPRYGTWEPGRGLGETSENWIAEVAGSGTSPGGPGGPGEEGGEAPAPPPAPGQD